MEDPQPPPSNETSKSVEARITELEQYVNSQSQSVPPTLGSFHITDETATWVGTVGVTLLAGAMLLALVARRIVASRSQS